MKTTIEHKYKFSKINFDPKFKKFLFAGLPYYLIAVVITLGGILIIESLYPPQPTGLNWTKEGVLMFMGICAGIGWVLHGTGFFIIKG